MQVIEKRRVFTYNRDLFTLASESFLDEFIMTLSHRNSSASTVTTPLASMTITPESPQLKVFVRSAMEKHSLT